MCDSDYKDIVMALAKRVKTIRKSQKMSVQELAYRCNMERSNMSRIESGRVNITIKTLSLISKALGVKMVNFFADEE